MKNKFTWNDSVTIIKSAPHQFAPGKSGTVCGINPIELKGTADEFHCNVGDWLYTVEFSDGSDIQIAELYLIKDEDDEFQ